MRPITCDTWLKALNAFCRWLHERGDLPTALHMKPLKVERRVIPTLTPAAVQAIATFMPSPTARTRSSGPELRYDRR